MHPITKTLLALKNADLTLRDQLIESGELFEGYHSEMEALHNKNATILDKIIDEIGYPTIDKVGMEGSHAAWLVIQHAISRPSFMRKCLRLLEEAVAEGKADPIQLASLSDRVAMFSGDLQKYGTQFDWDANGEMSPKPFDDLDKVNERRASVGLNTLEEQTKIMRARAAVEQENPPKDLEKRKAEMEAWQKRVGWK